MGSLVFQATLGGQVNLNGPNTASTFDIAVPATTGTMVTTGDSGTVTNTMLAASAYNTPGTIGSGTANTGAFTTLSASSTVSGTGFSTYLASPPAIGGTAAAAGSFTTLSASSTVSGTGFSTYLASPPAIGGTAAAAGTFTTLSGTTSVATPIVKSASSLTLQTNGTTTAVTVDTSQNVGIGTTSPGYKLDVRSSLAVLDGSANIGFWANGTTYTQVWQTLQSVNDFIIQTAASKYMSFGTNSAERMRIDSSGNVLVTGGGKLSLYGTPPNIGIDGTNATVTITNGNSIDFTNFSGTLMVTETNSTGSSAVLLCGGANTTVVGQANGANFTNTSAAGNIRFFYNAGTTAYRLQNSSGGTMIFNIVSIKTRAST